MRTPALPRAPLWPAVAAALAVALTSAAVFFRRPARARDPAPAAAATEAAEGVVCFGTVDLEHGVASLSPLQPGRVTEVLVAENQAVAGGAELLRLDDQAARSRLAEAEAAVGLSRLQVNEARKLPERHRGRVDRQQAALEAMTRRLASARQLLERKQKLSQTQGALVTAADLSANELQVRELEAAERVEAQRLAELKAEDFEADLRRAQYELAAAEARRDQARLALDECRLKSPAAGVVLRVLVGPGDVLGSERGQPALLFAADGPQIVRATVEQEFAARVKEGAPAVVHDDIDPGVSCRGRVERVAAWYSQRRAVLHDPSQLSDVRTLECVIALEPGHPRLRLGQGVRVHVGPVPP